MVRYAQIGFVFLAVILTTRFGGLFALPPAGTATFWPSNAVLLAALLLMDRRTARKCSLIAFPAYLIGELWTGFPLALAVVFSAANTIEVVLAAALINRFTDRPVDLGRVRQLLAVFASVAVASVFGAFIGASGTSLFGIPFVNSLINWSLSDMQAYVVLLAPILTAPRWLEWFRRNGAEPFNILVLEFIALAIVAVIVYGPQGQISADVAGASFLPIPLLLWIALRHGPKGAALASFLVFVIVFAWASEGYGPFGYQTAAGNVESLQLFSSSLFLAALITAAVAEERNRAMAEAERAKGDLEETVKERTRALDESRRQISTFIDNLPGGAFRCLNDKHWTMIFMSEGCAEITGYSLDEMLHNRAVSAEGMIEPEDRAVLRNVINEAVARGERYEGAYRIRTKSRGIRHVWEQGIMVGVDADGVGVIEGLMMDVTAQVEAEKQLRESEEQLRVATRIAQLGHWTYDEVNDKMTYCSDELARIHGQTVEQYEILASSTEGDIARAHPDDREKLERAIRGAQANATSYDVEYRIVRPDGKIRYLREMGEPIVSEDGRLLASHGTVQDITDLKLVEAKLRKAMAEAERANAAKSEFLALMSHEFRTPLNAISGFSDMIRSEMFGKISDERYREYADYIHDSGDHLLSIVNGILDLSKIEAGQFDIQLAPFELEPLVFDIVSIVEHSGKRRPDGIRVDIAPETETVVADIRSFRQILINLLTNADKYTPPSGRITIDSRLGDNGETMVRIVDEGVGIPEGDLERVLEPFGQAQHNFAVAHEGTGLGLSLSKRLMELHDGRLEIDSTVGKGTTIVLTLPAALRDEQRAVNAG